MYIRGIKAYFEECDKALEQLKSKGGVDCEAFIGKTKDATATKGNAESSVF